jgi:hypothetical protein
VVLSSSSFFLPRRPCPCPCPCLRSCVLVLVLVLHPSSLSLILTPTPTLPLTLPSPHLCLVSRTCLSLYSSMFVNPLFLQPPIMGASPSISSEKLATWRWVLSKSVRCKHSLINYICCFKPKQLKTSLRPCVCQSFLLFVRFKVHSGNPMPYPNFPHF